MKVISKLLSIFLITLFLGAMLLSLLHTSSHMKMSSESGMENCPFMAHDSGLCSMNLTNHINAWKTTFLAVVPIINIFLASLVLVSIFTSNIFSRLKYYILILRKHIKEGLYTFTYRRFQDLFSKGILHPKLF